MSRCARALILIPFVLTASAPEVWFCPLDPLIRASYGGSPQYMSLFTPNAPWAQSASHVNVFKIYPQWIDEAADTDLQTQFASLNRAGIALALEYGVLTASTQCGAGVEGFGGEGLMNAALRIKRNGGILRYLAMDEPIYFSTLYTGANACHWTVDQMAANAASNLRMLIAQFPGLVIGDIEPVPVPAANWISQYQAGIQAFRKALGFPLGFFHADVLWDSPTYLTDLASLRGMLASEGVRFGVIYNGNGYDTSDAQWIQSATQHMFASELNVGSPDAATFQSWNAYPRKLLPESDPDSFTGLVNAYFRRRTALTSSITGSLLQGSLTAADTGQPIAGALINVAGSPVNTLTGSVPPGATSIIFGARVNLECDCSGTTDLLVSNFSMDAGPSGIITRDFSNQLNGWGVSTAGFPAPMVKMEGANLHIAAQPGQSVALNSEPIPLPSAVPYRFHVNAQVAPNSSGSGYFTVIFRGVASEISRIQIPFSGGAVFSAGAITGANALYTLPLPATGADPFQVESSYAGSNENWPALATTTWPGPQPVIITRIANAASYAASAVSPGEIVALFGSGLGPAKLTAGAYVNGRLMSSIGPVTVLFDGIPAPLIYASDTVAAAIVPYGINLAETIVTAANTAGRSLPFRMAVTPSVPGLFTADSSGSGLLAALNADGSLNTANNPASPGDAIVLFGTGEGQTLPGGRDGLVMDTPARPLLGAAVTVDDQPASIDYFGSAPGEVAGVFQLNFRIPFNAPRGNAVRVSLKIGAAAIAQNVVIAIR
jgi:uncharacterized protein (TIGR03437 family)